MADVLPAGTKIGRFVLEAKVGQGGMGVVYRALDPALNRPVAIKLIGSHISEEATTLTRFHREATSIANLKHPHIATVYEFGEHEGSPYIAFEWVEGQTLTRLIDAEYQLPLKRTIHIVEQIGRALDYAHSRGIIHRDVKPSNILVGQNDHATLVDFGLSWLNSLAPITSTGVFVGTPHYCSPEQIRGLELDGRADLYSLAVVLYEMLAGRPPFQNVDTFLLLNHHLSTPAPPITEFNPLVPLGVERILHRALAKEPTDRFATAAELVTALRSPDQWETAFYPVANQGEPALAITPADVPASPAPNPTDMPAHENPKRPLASTSPQFHWLWPALTITLGCLLLSLLGLLSAPTLQSLLASPSPVSSPSLPIETTVAEILPAEELQPTPIEAMTPDIITVTIPVTITIPPTDTPIASPTPITPSPWSPPAEGGIWAASTGDSVHSRFVASGFLLPVAVHWSRNPRSFEGGHPVAGGGYVLFDAGGGILRALDWTYGLTVWEQSLGSNIVGGLALSPEAAVVVAATENGDLIAFNLADGALLWSKVFDELQGAVHGGGVVTADGVLYALTDTGLLHAFNVYDGGLFWTHDTAQGDAFYQPPAISSLGIFLAGINPALYAINPETLETMWGAEIIGGATTPPTVFENLGMIGVGTDQGWIHVFGTGGGEAIWTAQTSSAVVGLAYDVNNARLFATTADGNVYAWNAADGSSLWVLNTGAPLQAAPLTDGVYVVVGTIMAETENGLVGGDIRFVDAASGVEDESLRIVLYDPVLYTPAPAGGWLFVRGSYMYGVGP